LEPDAWVGDILPLNFVGTSSFVRFGLYIDEHKWELERQRHLDGCGGGTPGPNDTVNITTGAVITLNISTTVGR